MTWSRRRMPAWRILARNAWMNGAKPRRRRTSGLTGGRPQFLIRPGFGAVRIGADGKVAVEPDRQPAGAPGRRRGGKLAVGLPLQELEEFDPLATGAGEVGDRGRARIAHRGGPVRP